MTIAEISSLAIAIFSFCLSCYLIFRDRKNKMYDTLYQCYERIQSIHAQFPILSVSEMIYMVEEPDSDEAERIKIDNEHFSDLLDKELDFACYLVIKKQIKLKDFVDLFGGALAGREWLLNTSLKYKVMNRPYLYQVIHLCKSKKFLPLKENKRYKKMWKFRNSLEKMK